MTPEDVRLALERARDLRSEIVLLFRDIRSTDLRRGPIDDIHELLKHVRAVQIYAQACDETISARIRGEVV